MNYRNILLRLFWLFIFICLVPFLPIMIVFKGFASPDYIFRGTLNIGSHEVTDYSFFDIYLEYLGNILKFNFGESIVSGQSAITEVLSGFLTTSFFVVPALLIAIIVAILMSYPSNNWKKKKKSKSLNMQALLAFIPLIILAYIVQLGIQLLGIQLNDFSKIMVAAIVLSIVPVYVGSNQVKKVMEDIKESDFFEFHLSCGFDVAHIWDKITPRLIWIEILNFTEYLLIYSFAFSVFVEVPFNIDGMGDKFIQAVYRLDYPIIIGFCVFQIVLLSITGIVIDLIKSQLDPRITL